MLYTENPDPKWIIWLIRAIVGHHTDKKTHFLHICESFWPCTDPLWLKWVKWFTRVFLCTVSKWRPNNRFLFRVISILAKFWKNTFPKEFFNEIWLKEGEYE